MEKKPFTKERESRAGVFGRIKERIKSIFPWATWEFVKSMRIKDTPDEQGVGTSLKSETRGMGLAYVEFGLSAAAERYPEFVHSGEALHLYEEHGYSQATIPNDDAHPGVAASDYWIILIDNLLKKDLALQFDEIYMREVWQADTLARLVVAISMFNLYRHSFIRWNTMLSPRTSQHVDGIAEVPCADLGAGVVVSKQGLEEAMDRLDKKLADSKLMSTYPHLQLQVFKPFLAMYELHLRRIQTRFSMDGVGRIDQGDVYFMTGGCIAEILRRSSPDWNSGIVNLFVLIDHIDALLTELEPILRAKAAKETINPVEVAFRMYTCAMYAPTDVKYLEEVTNFKTEDFKVFDGDIYYARTLQEAIFEVGADDDIVPVLVRDQSPGTFAPGSTSDTHPGAFWVAHPYRPPSHGLLQWFKRIDGIGYPRIFFPYIVPPSATTWDPATHTRTITWLGNTASYVLADESTPVVVTNYMVLIAPHQPVTGAPDPGLLHHVFEPATPTRVVQIVPALPMLKYELIMQTGTADVNEDISMIHAWNAWRMHATFRYARWVRSVDEYLDLSHQWVISFFRGSNVKIPVIHHLSTAGPGQSDRAMDKNPTVTEAEIPGDMKSPAPIDRPDRPASEYRKPWREDEAKDPAAKRGRESSPEDRRRDFRRRSSPAKPDDSEARGGRSDRA